MPHFRVYFFRRTSEYHSDQLSGKIPAVEQVYACCAVFLLTRTDVNLRINEFAENLEGSLLCREIMLSRSDSVYVRFRQKQKHCTLQSRCGSPLFATQATDISHTMTVGTIYQVLPASPAMAPPSPKRYGNICCYRGVGLRQKPWGKSRYCRCLYDPLN